MITVPPLLLLYPHVQIRVMGYMWTCTGWPYLLAYATPVLAIGVGIDAVSVSILTRWLCAQLRTTLQFFGPLYFLDRLLLYHSAAHDCTDDESHDGLRTRQSTRERSSYNDIVLFNGQS